MAIQASGEPLWHGNLRSGGLESGQAAVLECISIPTDVSEGLCRRSP